MLAEFLEAVGFRVSIQAAVAVLVLFQVHISGSSTNSKGRQITHPHGAGGPFRGRASARTSAAGPLKSSREQACAASGFHFHKPSPGEVVRAAPPAKL